MIDLTNADGAMPSARTEPIGFEPVGFSIDADHGGPDERARPGHAEAVPGRNPRARAPKSSRRASSTRLPLRRAVGITEKDATGLVAKTAVIAGIAKGALIEAERNWIASVQLPPNGGETASGEQEALDLQLYVLRSDLQRAVNYNAELQTERRLAEQRAEEINSRSEILRTDLAEAEGELAAWRERYEAATASIGELEKAREQAAEHQREGEKLELQLYVLRSDFQRAVNRNAEFRSRLHETQETAGALSACNQALEQELASARDELAAAVERLTGERDELAAFATSLRAEIADVRQEHREELAARSNSLQLEIATLSQQRDAAEREGEKLELQLYVLRSDFQRAVNRNAEFRSRLHETQETAGALSACNQALEQELASARDELAAAQQKAESDLAALHQSLQEKLDSVRQNLEGQLQRASEKAEEARTKLRATRGAAGWLQAWWGYLIGNHGRGSQA